MFLLRLRPCRFCMFILLAMAGEFGRWSIDLPDKKGGKWAVPHRPGATWERNYGCEYQSSRRDDIFIEFDRWIDRFINRLMTI